MEIEEQENVLNRKQYEDERRVQDLKEKQERQRKEKINKENK
jgi:hypothetical protein